MVAASLLDGLSAQQVAVSPLLRAIRPDDWARVAAAAQIAVFGPGEMVYRRGEASQALAVLLEGEVRLSAPSLQGRELLISAIGPGQSFGEIGFFDGGPRSADATAVRRSRVLLVGRSSMLDAMNHTPALASAFTAAICQRLRRTTAAVQQAVFYGVELRLADSLLRLAASADRAPGEVAVVKVWQHDLAATIGMTRESVNKQLRRWQTAGVITITRGRIGILDKPALEALIAEMNA